MKHVIGLIALSIFLGACAASSGLSDGVYRDAQVRYKIAAPGGAWKPLRLQTADLSWMQPKTGSTLLVNSNCKGVKDVPLQSLTQHLLIGMTDKKIIAQETIAFSGRDAMETEVSAKIDGVPQRMKMLVMKKDGCVYDLFFGADPNFYEEDLKSYFQLKNGFSEHQRKR